jgi:DNA repair protein RadC
VKKKPDIREKVMRNGITYPTNLELIMLLLGTGTQGIPVGKLAQRVLNTITASSRDTLLQNLLKLEGIGPSKAITIAAAMEFGRRQNNHTGKQVSKPSDLIPFVHHYAMQEQEHFICVTLNGAHEIIKIRTVSVGTINKTMVHPREVFTGAIKDMAAAVILCHNHPSGNASPSRQDDQLTEHVKQAADLLQIRLADHLIVADRTYYSYADEGRL